MSAPTAPIGSALAGLRRRSRTMRRLHREMGKRVIGYVLVSRLLPERIGRVEWFTVMAYPCEPYRAPADGLSYRWATPDDVPMLTEFGLSAAEVRARIDVGDRARLCLDADGTLLAYAWYRFHAWDEAGVEFLLGPRDAWAYDFDVAPTVGGRRLLGRIGFEGCGALAEEGVTRVLGGVDIANRGVFRAFQRRRATTIGCITMAQVGRLSARRESWVGVPGARWRVYRGRRVVGLPSPGADRIVAGPRIATEPARP